MDGASCLNLNIRNTLGMLCWLLSCWSTAKSVARTWSEWAVVSLYHSNWIPAEFSVGKIEQIDACRPKEFLFPLLVTMPFHVVWVKLVCFVSVHISCSAAENKIMWLYHRLKNSGYQFLWFCARCAAADILQLELVYVLAFISYKLFMSRRTLRLLRFSCIPDKQIRTWIGEGNHKTSSRLTIEDS